MENSSNLRQLASYTLSGFASTFHITKVTTYGENRALNFHSSVGETLRGCLHKDYDPSKEKEVHHVIREEDGGDMSKSFFILCNPTEEVLLSFE
jgi:hypothetical protein